jgi:hypothetical protein
MTFLWLGVGGFAVLVVATVGIGFLMPERYAGRSHRVYSSTAEDVWQALLDYNTHPMTGKMMQSVQAQPAEQGLPVWIEDMGRGELVTVTTVEADRPRHMVRKMTSKTVPMTSQWEYTLEPSGEGCRLSIDSETYIRSGTWHVPLFRCSAVPRDDGPQRRREEGTRHSDGHGRRHLNLICHIWTPRSTARVSAMVVSTGGPGIGSIVTVQT